MSKLSVTDLGFRSPKLVENVTIMKKEKVVCPNGEPAVTCFSINGKVEQPTPFPGAGLENIKVEGFPI